jgi:hypothetical protein
LRQDFVAGRIQMIAGGWTLSCLYLAVVLYFFWGRRREIQQKGRGANENDKYLSRLSSLNLAAT